VRAPQGSRAQHEARGGWGLGIADGIPKARGWVVDAAVASTQGPHPAAHAKPHAFPLSARLPHNNTRPDPSDGSASEALRFPLACGELRAEADKAGAPCVVVDCVLHPDVLAGAAACRPLKAFLIELALDWVGRKHGLQLDPKFRLPKMAYKGAQVRGWLCTAAVHCSRATLLWLR
jgi:PIH1 N-terminal domain